MEISFRFEGFEEVQRGVEALSSSAEIGAINILDAGFNRQSRHIQRSE